MGLYGAANYGSIWSVGDRLILDIGGDIRSWQDSADSKGLYGNRVFSSLLVMDMTPDEVRVKIGIVSENIEV